MKKNFIFLFVFSIITFIHTSLKAQDGDVTVGLDIGYGFLDIGADETAQTIANLSGSTVTYSSDVGSWMGRVYGDLEIVESLYVDVGLFLTGDIEAKYTLSGATVTETYSANGVDLSLVFKDGNEGFYLKGGVHSSTVDGNASITISGTTYAANAAASGSGFVFGGGYDFADGSRFGYTYYSDLGGLSKADLGYIFYGYRF